MNEFGMNSRYATTERTQLEMADGRVIVYLKRRFVPLPERFTLLNQHTVRMQERLDQIAAEYLGDSEQFWRICDANNGLNPNDLTAEPGRQLGITLPEGIPGSPYA